jgi:predicted acyl esterase
MAGQPARRRHGHSGREVDEQVDVIVLDLVAASQVFEAGHRVRVEIASSNFPRFGGDLGTGRCPLIVILRTSGYGCGPGSVHGHRE